MDAVAKDILRAGGVAEAAVVDALDEQAVDKYLGQVVERAEAIDISFSAVGIANTTLQGTPLIEISLDSFMRPVDTYGLKLVAAMFEMTPPAAQSPNRAAIARHLQLCLF